MSAPEQEATKKDHTIHLNAVPEGSNVRIHVENGAVQNSSPKAEISKRSVIGMITGAIGAIVGYVSTKLYINQKMFDFDTEVLDTTKKNILGRSGLGASVAESGLGGGFAAGISTGEIHAANASKLAQSGKYGDFPKFIYKTLGGSEGRAAVALAGAAVVGTVAAVAAYSAVKPDKKPEPQSDKDWADKVVVDKDQPRVIS